MDPATDVAAALGRVTGALPSAEQRPGQVAMAQAVADAVEGSGHLIVQAGTGTGKSYAYLLPAVLSGKRTVVATATKALQDQLVGRDLPFLAGHIDRPFRFAALKGRSNYVCLQRVKEALQDRLDLDDDSDHDEVVRLAEWATATESGDRAELPVEPSVRGWAAVSVTSDECPGATRCPMGEVCFAERAKHAAAAADVVVVNTHLYGTHLAAGGTVLPEHDVVVFDEAHQLEDIVSATAGFEIGSGRFVAAARSARGVLAERELPATLEGAGDALLVALAEHHGKRVPPGALAQALTVARGRVDDVLTALRGIDTGDVDAQARRTRAIQAASALVSDLERATSVGDGEVAWVDGPPASPVLKVAPLDIAATLDALWASTTAVLTSATIPPGLAGRLGLRATELDVGSPFDFEANGLLYCAAHLPDPRHESYGAAVAEELIALVAAAGGRTLALFTSWRAMQAALEAVRPHVDTPILAQGELPKPALVDAFAADEATSIFATMGFWQGIDLPGRTLSLVVIDRIPFPRPDDPLLAARRDRVGRAAFGTIDLPRASTLLAQGAGRLIRTATDRGVVAVLDSRLASANYRWDIVRALPPMRRTRHRSEAEDFLRSLVAETQ